MHLRSGPSLRVVSLLPSATELLCSIGGKDLLVGRSHEDNYPIDIADRPILTSKTTSASTPITIDEEVSSFIAEGKSLYSIDSHLLETLRPDVILTQDICSVCAIDLQTVERLAGRMKPPPRIVSLNPQSVEDMIASVGILGRALGPAYEKAAEELTQGLQDRIAFVKKRAALRNSSSTAGGRIKVGFIEWTDPIYVGGHWTPQLVTYAGGDHPLNPAQPAAAQVGGAGKSFPVPREVFRASDPDLVVVAPCGFDLQQAHAEALRLQSEPWFADMRAARSGQVFAVDGDAMFNRPGPRLVQALEWLGSIINPTDKALAALAKDFPVIQLPPVSSPMQAQPDAVKPRSVVSVEEAHLAACAAGESMYEDPESKLFVFTELAHRKRGKCCGNKCRHCPFGHYNVPSGRREAVIKQTTLLRTSMRGGVSDSGAKSGPTKVLFWSGGKDSFLTLLHIRADEIIDGKGSSAGGVVLLTTTREEDGSVPHQEVPLSSILDQSKTLLLDHMIIPLPSSCSNDEYVNRVKDGLALLAREYGVIELVFGDLRLMDLVEWRRGAFEGYITHFPLFNKPYSDLMDSLFEQKHVMITVSSVVEGDHSIRIGDVFNQALVSRLPEHWDQMGENGEFHTIVSFLKS